MFLLVFNQMLISEVYNLFQVLPIMWQVYFRILISKLQQIFELEMVCLVLLKLRRINCWCLMSTVFFLLWYKQSLESNFRTQGLNVVMLFSLIWKNILKYMSACDTCKINADVSLLLTAVPYLVKPPVCQPNVFFKDRFLSQSRFLY